MADVIPKEIDRETLRALVRRGAQLIEVLPREEYNRVHLTGAASLPIEMLSRTTSDRLKWDQPVIVYAADNQDDRSARAAWRLASLGFTQVFRYTAGKADWLANGLPVEGASGQAPTAGDFADLDVPTCSRLERVSAAKERAQKEGYPACVVVNEQFVVLGLLRSTDLEKADPKWTAEEAMDRNPLAFRLDAALEVVAAAFRGNVSQQALVTTTDGRLFGLLIREEIEIARSKVEKGQGTSSGS